MKRNEGVDTWGAMYSERHDRDKRRVSPVGPRPAGTAALFEGPPAKAVAQRSIGTRSEGQATVRSVSSRHLGLNFESPFAIGELLEPGTQGDVTVLIRPGYAVRNDEPGPVVAQLKQRSSTGYTVYSLNGTYVFRFHDLCEFEVSDDGHSVVCLPGPKCTEGLLQVLMAGTLTAWLLTLRGLAVLHASVVRSGDATVVIAGHSGHGKSTVAALCCAAGAELVADDVAALQIGPGGIACRGLGSELRLRPQAFGIADLFSPVLPGGRQTDDGRLAIRPPRAHSEHNVVSAVLFPRPVRDCSEVVTSPLEPARAMRTLLANARIPGMVQTAMQKDYFETVATLVASVPVLEARVPWGPPFDTAVARDLLAQIAAATSPAAV